MKNNTKRKNNRFLESFYFDLEGRDWTLHKSGLDFLVVLFEDDAGVRWILRIPRCMDVQNEVAKEKRILDAVQPLPSIRKKNATTG